jgi:hypothetical protein
MIAIFINKALETSNRTGKQFVRKLLNEDSSRLGHNIVSIGMYQHFGGG